MTQEDKDLLIKDLCARLPYKVKCVSGVDDATLIIEGINPNCCGASEVQVTYERSGVNFDTTISAIKPYLFPMSSMTMYQAQQWHKYANDRGGLAPSTDWLDAHHFDYRGLIPKGLALDATNLDIY